MKNYLLLLAFLTFATTQAQDKVKGNREPSTVITVIAPFNSIEIGSDYEVSIVRGTTAQIEVTADSNLHQYLKPTVTNGLLTITSSVRIRSKKELKIRLIFPSDLTTIVVKENAELSTITDYEAPALSLEVRDDAKVFMTAKVERFNLTMKSGSKGELNFKGDEATVILEDNANLKALLDYDNATITMSSRSDARIDGDMKNATVKLESRAEFDGSNLVVKDLNVIVTDNATAKVNASSTLNLKSNKDGKTELHNTPTITIEEFNGNSILSKK